MMMMQSCYRAHEYMLLVVILMACVVQFALVYWKSKFPRSFVTYVYRVLLDDKHE